MRASDARKQIAYSFAARVRSQLGAGENRAVGDTRVTSPRRQVRTSPTGPISTTAMWIIDIPPVRYMMLEPEWSAAAACVA